MRRRTFLKFGSSSLAGLALGGLTRTPIFQIGSALASSKTAWKFGVLGDTQWTQHQLDSSTGLSDLSIDPAGTNPYSVAASIINQIDPVFVDQGVKFVIQVGDLTDCGTTRAIKQRALIANTNLVKKGIDFFPVRGNHETYGNSYGETTNTDYSIKATMNAFPQTQGKGIASSAHNFNSATDSKGKAIQDLKGISYSFDYGKSGSNARFLMLDCWSTGTKLDNNADGYTYGYTIGDQMKWISSRLNQKSRGTEHAFVFTHQPLMAQDHQDTIFSGYTYANPVWQNGFYSTLQNNGVRYYISGHDHIHQRSIIESPDGQSQVEQLICASCSSKFYTPKSLTDSGWVDTTDKVNQKYRETSISQEMYTVGFYIFTVDGPTVIVDYYSDNVGNWYSDKNYPGGGTGTLITPTLNFTKKETWGYSLSKTGVSTFQLSQESGYSVSFGSTTAQIFKQGGTAADCCGRSLTKNAEAWWASKSGVTNANAISDVLTLVGAASAAIEQNHNTSNTYISDDPVAVIMTYAAGGSGQPTLSTLNDQGKWVNSASLNFNGGTPQFISGPWLEGYPLGSYGFDATSQTAWAVVDHNSDFAVISGS